MAVSTSAWERRLVQDLRERWRTGSPWPEPVGGGQKGLLPRRLQLAVFSEPFLSRMLDGSKRRESRFSRHRTAPHGRVEAGDLLAIKAASGPIVALATITHATECELTPAALENLREMHAEALCADDPRFWERQTGKRYATILGIGNVTLLESPLPCGKKDRRGWVTIEMERR